MRSPTRWISSSSGSLQEKYAPAGLGRCRSTTSARSRVNTPSPRTASTRYRPPIESPDSNTSSCPRQTYRNGAALSSAARLTTSSSTPSTQTPAAA